MGKISAKDFVKDIRLGLSDDELKRKYNISDSALHAFFKKLIAASIISEKEIENRSILFKCPKCGHPSVQAFQECPKCGIVISKFKSKQESKIKPHSDDPIIDDTTTQSKSAADQEDLVYKDCPYCGEQILKVAKKCKHCGEFLEMQSAPKEDEIILWTDKPSTLWLAIVCALWSPTIFIFGLGLIIIIFLVLNWHLNFNTVTNNKISQKSGIIRRTTREIEIKDIRNINYTQNFLQLFLKVGSVFIGTAGTGLYEIVFKNINDPKKINDMISELKEKTSR